MINNAYTWLMAMLSCSASLKSSHEGEGNEKISLRADTNDPDPDIFVLGFQELDLSAEALIYYASTAREDAWCHAIFAALGEKAIKYEKVRRFMLFHAIHLILFISEVSLKATCWNARRSLSEKVTQALLWKCENLYRWLGDSWTHGTIKNTSDNPRLTYFSNQGNKGGTAIRLSFTPPTEFPSEKGVFTVGSPAPITFTFVNAHLAAFDEMTEKRNADFHDLSKRLNFDNNEIPPQPDAKGEDISPGPRTNLMETEPGLQPLSIYETDVLFWMVSCFSDRNNCV